MSKIRKLVIPVAGLGTRFLPATKAQPKEMLPVIDKPIIQYVVEDAVKSGITDIIMVTGPSKRAVEDHFSPNYELVNLLKKQGKEDVAEEVKKIADMANFVFIRQKGPYGNGTPVLCAKNIIGNEPFAVMWGDEFFYTPEKPQLQQLIEVYEKYGDPVVTACRVSKEDTKKYGIIDALEVEKGIYQVKKIIEKPGPEKAPSNLAMLGGFILTPDIFEALEKTKLGKDGELWLADAHEKVLKKRPYYACLVDGTYYDTGSKLGYLKANVDFALRDKKLSKDFRDYLKSVI
ncbi:MAG: UTP--glucose-1-phosphate uridylyltransferase [Candidatus Magasanikbacteria bacterium RIFOXYD2_FULL_39_9]|uniref:UTP--glucose-1-phosphate uridylyltransferase n=1 Tax=Candidatus Magasanikbacteria bacterium RIFOXYD1_FULL_40_23 TaxID=1798705 RepID=A0A1F6PAA1_9BACT|nr:MAG: UTP--glucose-1-phosphate uridylyltransferase [Candidatus Magasanikbacteria bacterium RIFOXYD2_FULL_39_9]OGH93048.1 MAG: UTP--glucose-1-phosphate uridylyltransferase [Candidatus Magasanikbacteria bacterium RIFOXYD1_FULL_40_23]